MKYNFDEVIERRGTDSVKYDAVSERWGRSDLLPMWVADMDFRTPPFVIEAIRRRLDHEVLGYTFACEAWYTSIINWQKERHGWNVTPGDADVYAGYCAWIGFCPAMFYGSGDKVMVMPPVYHPFLSGDRTQPQGGSLQSVIAERRAISD